MVKTIIFDIGDVLVEVDYHGFLNAISSEFNISAAELIKKSTNGAHLDYMRGMLTSEQFVEDVNRKYNQSISIERFRQLWNLILLRQNNDVADMVNNLHRQYQLVLLSNIDPWHFNYCSANFPVIQTFEKAFLSYEHHLLKPDSQFFKLVVEQLNVPPAQCLLIDDLADNVKSAEKLGYQIIQFKDAFQLQNDLKKIGIRLGE